MDECGELAFLGPGEQRHATDLAQVHADGIGGAGPLGVELHRLAGRGTEPGSIAAFDEIRGLEVGEVRVVGHDLDLVSTVVLGVDAIVGRHVERGDLIEQFGGIVVAVLELDAACGEFHPQTLDDLGLGIEIAEGRDGLTHRDRGVLARTSGAHQTMQFEFVEVERRHE